jgi:hypothetical protein
MGYPGWTVVFQGSRIGAEVLQSVLQAHGLRAEVFGDSAYSVAIDLTEARVVVPDEQASRARRLIKEAEEAEPLTEEDV